MHTAEAITRQIQQATDVVDVVSRYVRLARAGNNWKGLCPFHKEKTPSFHVVPAKQIFKCFGCGAGGDVFKFVQLKEGIDFKEARRVLAERAGIRLDQQAPGRAAGQPDRADLARVNEWASRWFTQQFDSHPGGAAARAYAVSRGMSPESIRAFGLGFAPPGWDVLVNAAKSSRIDSRLLAAAGLTKPRQDGSVYEVFRNRLMFPIRDAMDRIIGFGGRTLDNDPAKYLNTPLTPLFDKGRAFYGIDKAKNELSQSRGATIVEGYTDCILCHQYGFANTLATLGTALTDAHADVLRRYCDSVVLVFDSDEAGQRAAERALPMVVSQRLNVRISRVPEGKDPCDCLTSGGAAAFDQVLKSGEDALDYQWRLMHRRFDSAAGGPGRLRAIDEFLTRIADAVQAGAIDPIQRGLVINQIAALLGIDRQDVNRRLSGSGQRPPPASRADASAPAEFRMPPIQNSGDAAMRALLEVLVNEPGYFGMAAEMFDAARLPGELQLVARHVRTLVEQLGEFSLVDLLGRIESVTDAQCVMQLHAAGQAKGNYEATVLAAVARLKQDSESTQRADLRDAMQGAGDPHGAETALRDISAQLGRRRGFLPARLQRAPR